MFVTPLSLKHVLVWYGMVNVDLYSAIITKVSNTLNTLVSGEKPGFQALSEGLVVLLCAEVVRQGVPALVMSSGMLRRDISCRFIIIIIIIITGPYTALSVG